MSVLVATVVNEDKDYCLDIYARQINSFSYPNYDTYIVDVSQDPLYIERLWRMGVEVERIPPIGRELDYVCSGYNAIRDKVLYENFEWLFLLDSDVFVPLNILDYLKRQRNPVHAFTYFINDNAAHCLQFDNNKGFRVDPSTGDYLFVHDTPVNECRLGMDFDVYGIGLGCVFIHRSVLEQINFRTTKNDIPTAAYFFSDVKKSKIKPVIDTSIIPAHYKSKSLITDLRVYQ
tara:strand:- start:806 stop:1501 length:696 start_codon:yes stop_codon:yes gene_type:complete